MISKKVLRICMSIFFLTRTGVGYVRKENEDSKIFVQDLAI